MYGQVNFFVQQRFFNFFREKTFAFHLIETQILYFIPPGANDFNSGFNSDPTKLELNETSLPKCKIASA